MQTDNTASEVIAGFQQKDVEKQINTIKKKKYLMSYFPTWMNSLYADLKLFIDRKRGYTNLKKLFYNTVGYEINLDSPRSYNEKITWKKIYDRNPLLTITADKYMVRYYIRDILGIEAAEEILIPLYYVTGNPADIPFENLPDTYVVKPNHGSKMHIIIRDKKKANSSEIRKICEEWLKFDFGLYQYEWAYRNIKRKIIVEKLLQEKNGCLPKDFKLYCFHGKCKMIRVSENRFNNEDASAYYDIDWNLLPVTNPGYPSTDKYFAKPPNLNKMISISEKLSEKFDSVRVDLFNCNNKIFFGEITHYDASGMARFEPEAFDYELGLHWDIT